MKILLLGGTGAMGKYLTEYLSVSTNEVHITTRRKLVAQNKFQKYILGDAHEPEFLNKLLKNKYDVIVDFMVYNTTEFKDRIDKILQNTKQYVYLSSARVYANSTDKLIETSSRILDENDGSEYFKTDEYALTKAKQEDILINSKMKNWTIIRPYITYDANRLQLCSFEKESWLSRILNNKTVVLNENLLQRETNLTLGSDVAKKMISIIGNKESYTEIYQIVSGEVTTWDDVRKIYFNFLEKELKIKIKWKTTDSIKIITTNKNGEYQINYDRNYDRKFDNSKIEKLNDDQYKKVKEGIEESLKVFLKKPTFKQLDWKYEAKIDRITKDKTNLRNINSVKNKIIYTLYRFFPKFILVFFDFLLRIKNRRV